MIARQFHYHATEESVAEVLRSAVGPVAVLGGGTMLLPAMGAGKSRPETLIDIRNARLDRIDATSDGLILGAAVNYQSILESASIAKHAPLLRELAKAITGGPQIRNQGTIGGSACYANPSSDIPASLVALNAQMELVSAEGSELVPASDFFTGAFSTRMTQRQFLARIRVPSSAGMQYAFKKLKISESSWPLVTVSCLVKGETQADRHHVRLAIGGATSVPICIEVEVVELRPESLADLCASVSRRVTASIEDEWADELAGPGYRRAVAGTIAARTVDMAFRREEA